MIPELLRRIRDGIKVTSYAYESIAAKDLAAAADYSANDVLSDHVTAGTAWYFPHVARKAGGTFTITKATAMLSVTALPDRLTLYLFTQPPVSVLNDNVANTAVVAKDVAGYVGRIDFPAMNSLGTGHSEAIATPDTGANVPLEGKCDPKDDGLYAIAVTRDAEANEAVGMRLTFKLFSRQD